jgi:hypothetical protein
MADLIPSSTDEDETARDGVLSTLREWHALVIGLVVGAVVAATGAWEVAALFVSAALGAKLNTTAFAEIRREPWYALAGFASSAAGYLWVIA